MKAGLGSYSITLPNGLSVGAIVAVNAVGDIIDPDTGRVVAGVRNPDGTFADARSSCASGQTGQAPRARREHHDRPGGDQRAADQGAGAPHGVDGRRRLRARDLSVAHAGRRRHGVRAGDRTVDRRGRTSRRSARSPPT